MARKIALAGIGKIARDQHVPSIAASGDWELAATITRHEGVEGIENYTDIDAMLAACPDIDVISLCLPPVPRFEYAAAAIRAGRHVMLEKPPGATLAECHTLEAMAREAGVSIFATWHSREAASVEAARKWLADKTLKRLKITWLEDVRLWHPGQEWIWEPGGLGVFDPGINALSILTRILPVPVHLRSATLKFPDNRQTPIAADLDFRHPGGAEVNAEFDWRKEGDQFWNIEAETDAGTLVLSDGGANLSIDGAPVEASDVALDGEYPKLYARMVDLVQTGEIDMDLSPMVHVADAFLLGKRETIEPFD
ncbi:MAG: D-galactose 1-dehydrogenase [Rhizobiales bacterium]|mgnify:CR=1 FL=1|nr:D-galactose 1-dehydrogenase [Hyphomicrobiales bacterium]MBA69580.1 D-galactose 1-dehydrogenase [Hyphomicrobiales bacterium]|tara:strand:- start:446 stop:1375 length:930 start_codon:yes stop_codon:yes gene_type:complete